MCMMGFLGNFTVMHMCDMTRNVLNSTAVDILSPSQLNSIIVMMGNAMLLKIVFLREKLK